MKPDDQDHEHRRPVAGVGRGQVEAAGLAAAATFRKPSNSGPSPQLGQRQASPASDGVAPAASAAVNAAPEDHVDEGEQEQPHHVDEVPVPGGRLEAEVLLRA